MPDKMINISKLLCMFQHPYFIRFIAGFATTVTSNRRIKENVSKRKKAIKKNKSRNKHMRKMKVINVRLFTEDKE